MNSQPDDGGFSEWNDEEVQSHDEWLVAQAKQKNAEIERAINRTPGHSLWYVGSPVSTYHTERYEHMRRCLEIAFPGGDFLFSRGLYQDSPDWLIKWPMVLEKIDGGMYFFSDERGYIGKGVWEEIAAVKKKRLPVFYYTEKGDCIRVGSPRLLVTRNTDNWKQFAHIEVQTERE